MCFDLASKILNCSFTLLIIQPINLSNHYSMYFPDWPIDLHSKYFTNSPPIHPVHYCFKFAAKFVTDCFKDH